ncbi:Luc7-related [Vigna unguiculata]|uniref:Luc7-related n=1 Tax=Vigna unguiculata TaxID=3917 RepID=A0A4D6KWK9_VIGUN|nr:Luc7-related [Vigna unguiculata]QCD78054.1 Luc7-related [Vigna unguiculata]
MKILVCYHKILLFPLSIEAHWKEERTDNYDRELEHVIDKLIGECDRKISRALKRFEDEDAKASIVISVSTVTQTLEVFEMSKEIKEKLNLEEYIIINKEED